MKQVVACCAAVMALHCTSVCAWDGSGWDTGNGAVLPSAVTLSPSGTNATGDLTVTGTITATSTNTGRQVKGTTTTPGTTGIFYSTAVLNNAANYVYVYSGKPAIHAAGSDLVGVRILPDLSNNHTGGNWISYSAPTLTSADADIGKIAYDAGAGYDYLFKSDVANIRGNGHVTTDQATSPALSLCGTNPAIATGSSDFAGVVTLGTGSPTACTVTFQSAFANTPACSVTSLGNATTYISAQSASAFTVTGSATFTGFNYVCVGVNE